MCNSQMSASIKLNTAQYGREVDAFIRRSERDFKFAIMDATNEMHKMAKKKVRQQAKGKVRSGHLTNEIHQKIYNGGFTGEVIPHASYYKPSKRGPGRILSGLRIKRFWQDRPGARRQAGNLLDRIMQPMEQS